MRSHAPPPVGLPTSDEEPMRNYYDAAYEARSSIEVAVAVLADLKDSRDPLELLRRHLAHAYARGMVLGRERARKGSEI